jgi:hypothetical protein
MAVHNVDVNPVSFRILGALDVSAQIGKVSG